MTPRGYFTEQDARALIGRRVRARVAISRHWLRQLGLWIEQGSRGTVTKSASGPNKDEFVVGVYWYDPRPMVPRCEAYPTDWYTEKEYLDLLEAPVEKAA